MHIQKHVLAEMENVYAVCSMELSGEKHFLAGTQAHGKCLIFSPPDWRISEVWSEPGGSMSLVPMKGRSGALLAIQEFYAGFQSETAGIVYAEVGENLRDPWNVRRVIDLPFVHRFEIVDVGGILYIVASTLCGGKSSRDDWSKPGAVYAGRIPDNPRDHWILKPILQGISKNHGMYSTVVNGRQTVVIAGQEGVFSIQVPTNPEEAWRHECLIDHEVSDVFVYDIDGDGIGEIMTIEPFHGDAFVIYKHLGGRWQSIFKASLKYGHALWGGEILGMPAILLGSRAGAMELALLRPKVDSSITMDRTLLDEGVGPTQLTVTHEQGCDLILSANNSASEVALYEITP